jgi:putative transposase
LLGRNLSYSEISQANKELSDAIEQWRSRDLSKEAIKFLFIDGVNFKILVGDSIDNVTVLAHRGDA